MRDRFQNIRPSLAAAVPAILVIVLAASPVTADWLVTRDGARIETAGPWKVKGNQVIFTLPNGTLSSLRASEIDLDASAVATTQAKAAAEAPDPATAAPAPKERPKPVLVVTDKDVRRAAPEEAAPSSAEESEGDDEGIPGAPPVTGPISPVEVAGFQTRENAEGGGLEIYGTLRNNGNAIASSIEMSVHVSDAEGKPLFETSAFLQTENLSPGKSTTFRALLPGVTSLAGEPRFEIRSAEIQVTAASPLPKEGESPEGDNL